MSVYAAICTDIAPLYSAPQKGVCIDEALCGMTVERLETACGFAKIRTHYRYEGWTPELCLCGVRSPDAPLSDGADGGGAWCPNRVVLAPYLDVLDAPKVQGVQLQGVPRGGLLCAQGVPDADLWQCVRLADGRRGYTKATCLQAPAQGIDPCAMTAQQQGAFRTALCETALRYLGTQYRWGGKTPLGIDCSGLTSMTYLLNGLVIYRDASIEQGFPVRKITFAQAQRGDLLYFPGHIALYLGDKRFVHATAHPGSEGVVQSSLDEAHDGFRPDLLRTLCCAGTVF
ncbi:MAG: C40 family peptidase [Ruthenibacterium sp.]